MISIVFAIASFFVLLIPDGDDKPDYVDIGVTQEQDR